MHKTSNAFYVLQATAAIVGLAILLWSLGLPSLRFAEAASVTTFSDTLSNSAPGAASDHTIEFTTPTGVANNSTIVLNFSDGPFVLGSVNFTDIDVATSSGQFTLAADCSGAAQIGVNVASWPTLTLTMCNGDGGLIASNGTTTILIGDNATGGAGNDQLTNPVVGSYQIPLTAGASDSGETRVAIVNTVLVTASVDTLFTFTVAGLPGGTTVNTADVSGGTTTATTIPFGLLDPGTASTAAQRLSVVTNARSGFVVTVQADGMLESSSGADIDGFIEGAYTTTPTSWVAPTPTIGQENSYGHWGITSDDAVITESLNDHYGSGLYVSASTTPVEVFRHTTPTDGTGSGEGTTIVGYKVQVSSLQEAAEDYQATLTYVATPVF